MLKLKTEPRVARHWQPDVEAGIPPGNAGLWRRLRYSSKWGIL
jgi:hypothetical protein